MTAARADSEPALEERERLHQAVCEPYVLEKEYGKSKAGPDGK